MRDRSVHRQANAKYLELVGGRAVLGNTIRAAFPDLEGQGLFELLDHVRATGTPYVGNAQRVMLARGPKRARRCLLRVRLPAGAGRERRDGDPRRGVRGDDPGLHLFNVVPVYSYQRRL